MPLTDTAVKNAKPKEKPFKLADAGGMYLEVSPSGGKWWRLKYRIGGKEKRISLGVYPDVSLAEARELRDAAKKAIKAGTDPSQKRKDEKAAQAEQEAVRIEQEENTFQNVALEWFAKNAPTWAETNSEKILSRLKNYLFPWIGSRPIKEITASEVLACLRRIEERGAIETAHRTKQIAGQIFRYAISTARASNDPTSNLRGALAKTKSKHHAAITDPKKLADLLRAMDGYSGSLIVRSGLKLSALLFVRPGELRHMEWSEIDFDTAEWNIPGSKMKMEEPHLVPLCRQALAMLRELQPLTSHGRYVFPSERGASRPMSENTTRTALRAMGYDNNAQTPHGFRATARTILDEVLGWRPDLIEHQLAHEVRDPNGRSYNRTAHLDARREMMQAWADYLDGLRKGADVVSINSKRA